MSITTTIIFAIPLTDSSNAVTMSFMEMLWERILRGLSVLSNLKIFRALKSTLDKLKSMRLLKTMKQSSYDQESRRYDPLS